MSSVEKEHLDSSYFIEDSSKLVEPNMPAGYEGEKQDKFRPSPRPGYKVAVQDAKFLISQHGNIVWSATDSPALVQEGILATLAGNTLLYNVPLESGIEYLQTTFGVPGNEARKLLQEQLSSLDELANELLATGLSTVFSKR